MSQVPASPIPDQLIEQHIGLVDDAVRYFRRRLPSWADFAAVRSGAHVGLMEAARKHDPARISNFKRYARSMIHNRIKDELRALDFEPHSRRALRRRVILATEELRAQLGRPPYDEEIAAYRGVTLERHLRDKAALLNEVSFVSMDELLCFEDGERTLHSVLGVEDVAIERADKATLHRILVKCVKRLPVRYQSVLWQTYFEGLTPNLQATKRNCSREMVLQRRNKALVNLRSVFSRECLKHGIQTSEFSRMSLKEALYVRPSERIAGVTRPADNARRTRYAQARAATPPPESPRTSQVVPLSLECATLLDEAQRLADQHDGVHDMRQACAIVQGYASLAQSGDPVDIVSLKRVVAKMRICHQTGFYPKSAGMLDQAVKIAAGSDEPLPTAA